MGKVLTADMPVLQGSWSFDTDVAARFHREAHTHLPHYEEVVDACVRLALKEFPERDARIIDVGSALGYTIERMIEAGFNDVWGVECSAAMIAQSGVPDKVIYSQLFPESKAPFDLVTANWTLHFIEDRHEYIRSIRRALAPGGILVITDKMTADEHTKNMYYDWKRSMGVSDEEIRRKEIALRGVLVPQPLDRYVQTLSEIGFKQVDVVHRVFSFNTLVARL